MITDRDTPPAAPSESPDTRVHATTREHIDVLSDYQEQEQANVPPLQAAIEWLSNVFGSPAYLVFVVCFIAAWIAVNLVGKHVGWRYVDDPPFFWLQGLVSSNALLLTVAVLIRQNRMSVLAERRAHLDLHVNLLTERKISKVLELLDVLRERVAPDAAVGNDHRELAHTADPQAILDAIKGSEADAREAAT